MILQIVQSLGHAFGAIAEKQSGLGDQVADTVTSSP